MDVWPWILDERRALLDTFEDLTEDQWEVPSLSEGWTVREVLAHLVLAMRPPLRRYAKEAIKRRRSFDRINHELAVEDARRPVEEVLAAYRDAMAHRFSPPGWPTAAPLGDVLLHGLDVRIPLGLPTARPPERFVPAMGLLTGRAGRAIGPKGRPAVRWVATDHEWATGEGAEVRGPIADLALAASGRPARLDQLQGDGAAAVRAWLA